MMHEGRLVDQQNWASLARVLASSMEVALTLVTSPHVYSSYVSLSLLSDCVCVCVCVVYVCMCVWCVCVHVHVCTCMCHFGNQGEGIPGCLLCSC